MELRSNPDAFVNRLLGPSPADLPIMLETIGVRSLDELIDRTVPASIRLEKPLRLPAPAGEAEALEELRRLADRNRRCTSLIGMGYADCVVPAVIQRNVLENPSWYTPYTPYQAELAQGRLEALLNFQSMVADLTALPVANASLLDEGTAAAEAMCMLHRSRPKDCTSNAFFVAAGCYPQTVEVLKTRAEPLGLELVLEEEGGSLEGRACYGALFQYPAQDGGLGDPAAFVTKAHGCGARVAVATDLLALVLLVPPGEFGADVAVGSCQRFGLPLGFGGPHAAFFAAREEYVRQFPGRIIGVSKDRLGRRAYRMALQTREQHIRRERATSNICTSQALLATMAGLFAVYHGREGLQHLAGTVHGLTGRLHCGLASLGVDCAGSTWFDTVTLRLAPEEAKRLHSRCEERGINLRRYHDGRVGVALNQTSTEAIVDEVLAQVAEVLGRPVPVLPVEGDQGIPENLQRSSSFLQHAVFRRYRGETGFMRYVHVLESRDLGLNSAMIPLGSCTMKLNAAATMLPLSWPELQGLHPFAPAAQTEGFRRILDELSTWLAELTGLAAVSFQPNSGAQGEYTGLLCIRAYHRARGESCRNVMLIPTSAHGTNPASAVMAGFKVVVVGCDERGNIDLRDLAAKVQAHAAELAGIMVTYPSTHGVFEEGVTELCAMVHGHGGLVYMDGANLNAQVGLTSPGRIGADVCHLNLHKTFGIPHGGGGPGMGPICVSAALAPYLPSHPVVSREGASGTAVSSAPWGSALILVIPWMYLRMLGAEGVTEATRTAILNANYLKARLQKRFPVLYTGSNGTVAHEMILDLHWLKKANGIGVEDVAKRLMDYGFHAPTMSWPVVGTVMVEPTESEPLAELDRFCQAMLSIADELADLEEGRAAVEDNVLRNAPHPLVEVVAESWEHPYSRERAVFPTAGLRRYKAWPYVARVDNAFGDRHLVCRREEGDEEA